MSSSGEIVFYTRELIADPCDIAHRLIALFAPNLVINAWMRMYDPIAWDQDDHIQLAPETDAEVYLSPGRSIFWRRDPVEIYTLFPSRETLTASLGHGPRAEAFVEELDTEISEPIRGRFRPGQATMVLGPHDIIGFDLYEPRLSLAGHANLSISMKGQSTAHNCPEYERIVFDTKAVRRLRADLEVICGPLKHWVGWIV